MQQQVYSELDRRKAEIRVLVLQASGTDRNSPLRCQLAVVSLNDSPNYDALSYTWGDAKSLKSISLQDYPFQVTANLYDALCNFRRADGDYALWVDALCINQEDESEKEWQVAMMGRVYRQCSRCQVWLGLDVGLPQSGPLPTVETMRASPMVSAIRQMIVNQDIRSVPQLKSIEADDNVVHLDTSVSDVASAFEIVELQRQEKQLPFFRITNWPEFELCAVFQRAWRSLALIFARAWWTRVWTLQEVALPKMVTLNIGHHQIALDLVLEAFGNWHDPNHPEHSIRGRILALFGPIDEMSRLSSDLNRLHGLKTIRDAAQNDQISQDEHGPILHWSLAQERNCSVPVDKVYGFLGLLPWLLEPGESPDYQSSPAQLFTKVTRRLITRKRNLEHLRLWTPRQPQSPATGGLPSWTVDYVNKYPFRPERAYRACGEFVQYSASQAQTSQDSLSAEIIDLGQARVVVPVEKADDWADYPQAMLQWQKKLEECGFDDLRAFCRTVFGDSSFLNPGARMSEADFATMIAYSQVLHQISQMGTVSASMDLQSLLNEKCPGWSSCKSSFAAGHGWAHGFTILDNGCIAMANLMAKEGDTFAVMKGLKKPVVLHATPGSREHGMWPQYHFLGTCYVDGFMDGEALDKDNRWQKVLLI